MWQSQSAHPSAFSMQIPGVCMDHDGDQVDEDHLMSFIQEQVAEVVERTLRSRSWGSMLKVASILLCFPPL